MLGLIGFKAYGHLVLNICRVLNIIGLLSAVAACAVILAKTEDKKDGWWFFDSASYFFSGVTCLFLIPSELGIFGFVHRYYEVNWPVLSHSHGMSWLSIIMGMVSFHILGAPYNPRRELEGSFKDAVLAGGFLPLITAIVTFVFSLVFRDGKNGISARNIRSDGKLASAQSSLHDAGSFRSAGSSKKGKSMVFDALWGMFRGGKDKDEPRPRPVIRHNVSASEVNRFDHDVDTSTSIGTDRRSPINPGINRPPTAMHPYHLRPDAGAPDVPRYSESSHLERWGKDVV